MWTRVSHAAPQRKPSRSHPRGGCQSASSAGSPFGRKHCIVAWLSLRADSWCRRCHDPGKSQYIGPCCRHPACLAESRCFMPPACLLCTTACPPASIRRAPCLLNTRGQPAGPLRCQLGMLDIRSKGSLRMVIPVHACLAQPHRNPLLFFCLRPVLCMMASRFATAANKGGCHT